MLKTILYMVLCTLLPVRSELVNENFTKYQSNDLLLIVVKGNYSENYQRSLNDSESYLFLYDYMPVILYIYIYIYAHYDISYIFIIEFYFQIILFLFIGFDY